MRDKGQRAAQMRKNADAVLELYDLRQHLTLFGALPSRTIYQITCLQPFLSRMRQLVAGEKFTIEDRVQLHGATATTSWRENRNTASMQITYHGYDVQGTISMAEVDFDQFNPQRGYGVALCHLFGEVLWPGDVDSFKIARTLKKRGIRLEILA